MGKVTETFSLLVAVFGTVIISACNIPGSILVQVYGNYVTIGTFLFPLTFILFDLNTYFYGPVSTRKMLLFITYSQILLFVITFGISKVTGSGLYTMSLRVMLGSVLAFFTASFLDTHIFDVVNTKLNKKYIWLTSNISSIIGQVLDSAVFAIVVFVGTLNVWQLVDSTLVIFAIKILCGAILTPTLYIIKPIIKNQMH